MCSLPWAELYNPSAPMSARYRTIADRCLPHAVIRLAGNRGSVEMRKITFAVYNPPKEGLPYLAVIIAPNGDVAAAAAYKTAAEAETYSQKMATETAKALQ
jgi:hypothetical protein